MVEGSRTNNLPQGYGAFTAHLILAKTKTPSRNSELQKTVGEQIRSVPVQEKKASWIQDEWKATSNIHTRLRWEITQEEVEHAISKYFNWKAPELDNVHHFWFKQCKSTHKQLAKCHTYILKNLEETVPFITNSVTYMLPKTIQYTEIRSIFI